MSLWADKVREMIRNSRNLRFWSTDRGKVPCLVGELSNQEWLVCYHSRFLLGVFKGSRRHKIGKYGHQIEHLASLSSELI